MEWRNTCVQMVAMSHDAPPELPGVGLAMFGTPSIPDDLQHPSAVNGERKTQSLVSDFRLQDQVRSRTWTQQQLLRSM